MHEHLITMSGATNIVIIVYYNIHSNEIRFPIIITLISLLILRKSVGNVIMSL